MDETTEASIRSKKVDMAFVNQALGRRMLPLNDRLALDFDRLMQDNTHLIIRKAFLSMDSQRLVTQDI